MLSGSYRSIYWVIAFILFAPEIGFTQDTRGNLPPISIDRMRADVKYLASDLLQGRGVGTRGEELATDFIADQFQKAGLKPAGENGTWFQKVPLVMVKSGPDLSLEM